ncbi:cytoskeleton-associated protein 2-like [Bombina bombina]|uniref:cytoskeleton-associated protein 2-like n=1 Tax=Bombina bombina TaxID=8345 RepID=UPI00235AD4A4|nr:cytoskeleton-associated protein 2-like [Bombina bombina]
MYLGKKIMEVKRLVSAEEARRQKLIEYLTAKGKLKPQNNPKPYLKECTNRQNKLTSQVSKTAPVCKQRENVPPKGKSAHPSSSIRTNSNSCVQQTKNVPSKLPTKTTISESTKPKTTNVSRNIQSKHRKINSSKQQKDSPGRIGEAAVKNAHGKNITCELPQNCTTVLDGSEECKSNLIQRESVMQEKDCPIADGLRIENASCSVNKSVNVCGIVQKPSLPGFNKITQAKCKTANAVPQSRSTSSRMTSKSLTDKSKTSYGKDNSKPLPRALHGQRQTSKPVVRVNTGQTKPVSRPNLSTKILNTNNATQTWPVKSSKIETSHQRDPRGAKTTLAPKNNHKTQTVRNLTPCLQSTIAVRRNIGVVQKGTVSSNLKSGSSCVIAPKKISSRPAPSAHSRDIISKKALDNQRGILPVKQGPRWYSTGSSISTRPAPKNPGSVVVSSVKPVGTMKKEGLVTVNKSVKHNKSVVNHTTSQATDTGTSNPARTQYFTPKSAAEDRRYVHIVNFNLV